MLVHWFDQNQQQLPLPPVLPLLAHQGPRGWKLSCEFAELFGTVPESLHPYLLSFRHALVDLAPMDDGSLSTQVRLRAFLKALKYNQRSDLGECFDVVLAEAATLSDRDLLVILTYLGKSPTVINDEVLHETLERLVPDRKERIVGWLTQPYYEKGKAEGRAEGKAEGEARILARLLERRFGNLPLTFQQRLFTADVAAIESWVERAFDAPDLPSVFESN